MATAKQLAARKLFVQRVRAGEFASSKPIRKSNPAKKKAVAKRKGPAKANSVSQITGKKPTPRLKARRAANTRAGYFPNPTKTRLPFSVEEEVNGKWKLLARFATREGAFAYARAYNAANHVRVRVVSE